MLVSPLEICLDVAHEANGTAIERSEMSTNVNLIIWNSGFGHWIRLVFTANTAVNRILRILIGILEIGGETPMLTLKRTFSALRCAVHILGEEKWRSLTPLRALRTWQL
jgi:hypothetical protein